MTNAISRAKQHSEQKIKLLRGRLEKIVPQRDVVVTCGSYARREASLESDIDFFVISQQDIPPNEQSTDRTTLSREVPVRDAISAIVPIEAAGDGAFSKVEFREAMLHNIGGESDNNGCCFSSKANGFAMRTALRT
jgi:predicted nucleotidyltransferase